MKRYIALGIAAVALMVPLAAFALTQPPTCTVTATPSEIPSGTSTPVRIEWTAANTKGVVFNALGEFVSGGGTNSNGYAIVKFKRATNVSVVALSNPTFQNSGTYGLCNVSILQRLSTI